MVHPSEAAAAHPCAHLKTASRDRCNTPDNTFVKEVNHHLSRVQKEQELWLNRVGDSHVSRLG